MTIATENVSETEIENENQAEDHPSVNGNRNGNVNGNENGIVVTRGEIPRIVQDIKREKRTQKTTICVCVCGTSGINDETQ